MVDEVTRAMWITTGWNQKWVGSKKIKWTRKKIYVWRKNFPFCQYIFSFFFGFSTFVLEHFGLWKVGIINDFGFILVYYYLTIIVIFNQISFKKWIKIVYFLLISHNFVLIPNKTSGIYLAAAAFLTSGYTWLAAAASVKLGSSGATFAKSAQVWGNSL